MMSDPCMKPRRDAERHDFFTGAIVFFHLKNKKTSLVKEKARLSE